MKKIHRDARRIMGKELREGLTAADAESAGRLWCARGGAREAAPDAGATKEGALKRRAWLRGYDAEEQDRAARSMSPQERARRFAALRELQERIAKL